MVKELIEISIDEYLKLCNFTYDFNPPNINVEYLIKPYLNYETKKGFKLIHKLLFYTDLLKQYIEYLKNIQDLDIIEFLLDCCKNVSLIELCINFKLINSFTILCNISNLLFIDGIYKINNLFIGYDKKYICKDLNLLNKNYDENIINIYLYHPEIINNLNENNISTYNIINKYNYKKFLPNNLNKNFEDLKFIIVDGNLFENNDFNRFINLNFMIENIDKYKKYINENYMNNNIICNLVIENIIKNYKEIDCNKVLDNYILKLIIQCYKNVSNNNTEIIENNTEIIENNKQYLESKLLLMFNDKTTGVFSIRIKKLQVGILTKNYNSTKNKIINILTDLNLPEDFLTFYYQDNLPIGYVE